MMNQLKNFKNRPKPNSMGGSSKMTLTVLGIIFLWACGTKEVPEVEPYTKPRVIVTCDPECDDQNSLIRFLLHATDFRIEGLVYASSQFHWKGDGKGTKWFVPGREYTRFGLDYGPMESWRWAEDERFIHDVVEAYEEAYPNLKVHDPKYPTPEYLKSIIKWGNIEFDGDISKDTEGSELIEAAILDDVPGPLFITAWGGGSTIARALKSIQIKNENTAEWEQLKEKISNKVKLALSGDQDDTYANYIEPNWPGIEVLRTRGGGIGLAYNVQASVKPEYAFYYEPEWIEENITSRGPMGAQFRVWGDGKQMVKDDIFDYFGFSQYTAEELTEMGYIIWTPLHKKGSWLGEGDTGTFLNFLDNGLRAWEGQEFGGWGGRMIEDGTRVDFTSFMADSTASAALRRQVVHPDFPEFLPAAQNELAARFKWAVSPSFEEANHPPIIEAPLTISAKAGERIQLDAKVSDPDGDAVTLNWMKFNVGYEGDVTMERPDSASTSIIVPKDIKAGEAIHVVLEAEDHGSPALTRYHRVIINIQ